MASTSSATAAGVPAPRMRHQGPPLGVLAVIFTVLFCGGLLPVTTFGGRPYFPGPWESAGTIVAFFQTRPFAALLCAFFQFGSAIPLGIFTATMVARLKFLGVRAAGLEIAAFGGLATAIGMIIGTSFLWATTYPGVSSNADLVQAIYRIAFGIGGPGYSVPFGLLAAGISIPAAFSRLLPKWVVILGIGVGVVGVLSWFEMLNVQLVPLIPLTRFPGFVWIIAAGFTVGKRPSRVATSMIV